MDLPEFCLRGIRRQDWILPDEKVSAEAFEPDKNQPREDGLIEASINWEDDETVLYFCFDKCKDTFVYGAVRLAKNLMDHLIANNDVGRFSYERKEIKNNEHHGNLLFDSSTQQRSRRLLQGALALYSSRAIHDERIK